tara:strand:- start:12083 stop:13045 length:963 start_codon:yes stop_codon:yes gene_type:complete
MATPFSLEEQFSGVRNIAQEKSRQRMFDNQAVQATNELKEKIEKMQAKAKKQGGLFAKFGKNAGLIKTLTSIALSAIPGVGPAAALAMNAADLRKTQNLKKEQIKDVKKMRTAPSAKYKGTFLEDYLTGGLMSSQSQLGKSLKSQKQMGAIIGGLSLIPGLVEVSQGIPGAEIAAKEAGKKAGDAAIDNLQNQTMNYIPEGLESSKPLNNLFANIEQNIMDAPSRRFQAAGESIVGKSGLESISSSAPGMQSSAFSNKIADLASKVGGMSVPYTNDMITINNLTGPVGAGATTMAEQLARQYFSQTEEGSMSRAKAPKFY